MLRHLQISNYALIRQQDLTFGPGLVVFTGETGSGKSILLGALGLVLGDRADSKVMYQPDQKCLVEATFDIRNYQLQALFEAHDLDYEDELIIRREIAPGGKSRAFINDTPVSLSILQEFSAALLDLHQQFDTLDLVNASFQLNVLDAVAGNMEQRNTYQQLYRQYQQSKLKLEELRKEEKKALNEQDYLMFQWKELEEANLQEGELEVLENESQTLSHAEDIKRHYREAIQWMDDSDYAILPQISRITQSMHQISRLYVPAANIASQLENIQVELSEIHRELSHTEENVELDPKRLQEVEERLQLLYRLFKKHQVNDLTELLQKEKELRAQANKFESLGESIRQLEKTCELEKAELLRIGELMHKNREKACEAIEGSVQQSLERLHMPQARLKIEIKKIEEPGPMGLDQVKFLVATNKGSDFMPIKEVASGGELSRIALAIKSLVAKVLALPTMIFDEIDTGVSGQVALQMGQMLQKLSVGQQVMVITHTAQVASRADQHMIVYKTEQNGQTISQVRVLNEDERIYALAVMLSTDPPSPSALENAKELISLSGK